MNGQNEDEVTGTRGEGVNTYNSDGKGRGYKVNRDARKGDVNLQERVEK